MNRKRPEALKASGRLSRDLCGGVSACFLDKLLPAFPAAEVVRLIIHTQYICLALFYHFAAVIILNQLIQQFIFQLSFLLLQCQIYVSRLGLDFFILLDIITLLTMEITALNNNTIIVILSRELSMSMGRSPFCSYIYNNIFVLIKYECFVNFYTFMLTIVLLPTALAVTTVSISSSILLSLYTLLYSFTSTVMLEAPMASA